MSDLISRSELYMNNLIRRKDVLELFSTNDCSDKMIGLYERVLDIPTAYDVEKVVAEIKRCSGNGYRDVDGDYVPPMIETKDTIHIVRKGGVK